MAKILNPLSIFSPDQWMYLKKSASSQRHSTSVAANEALTARTYTGFRSCLHGHGGPQVGEVSHLGGVTCLSI